MSENIMAISELKSSETEFAICECCGMTEEYTVAYIESVRDLYAGKFICGLCSEAVKYEIFRLGKKQRRIGVDEALAILVRFCGEFVASPSPTVDFKRRNMDLSLPSPSPESIQAVDGGAICAAAVISGAGNCLPALSGGA